MKPEWNEALAAYDRELDVLTALGVEYESFLEATCDEVVRRLSLPYGGSLDADVMYEEDEVGKWWVVHTSGHGLEVRIWPAAPWGGPAGVFRVGVFFNSNATQEGIDASAAMVAVEGPLGALDGVPGSSVTDRDLGLTESICLRVATVPIDKDFLEPLVETSLAYCRALPHAAAALEALHTVSSYP